MPDQLNESTLPSPRRSLRTHKPPSHLKDFISTDAINAHWCNLVNLDHLPSSHNHFTSQDHTLTEPKSYNKVVQDPSWVQAMNAELQALQQNDTWTLVPLPQGRNL